MNGAKYRSDVVRFAKSFDENKHAFVADYIFYLPNLFTKTNPPRISKKSFDWSNIIKPVEDCIYKPLSKINPQIDDAQVIAGNVRKIQSNEYRIDVTLTIVNHH